MSNIPGVSLTAATGRYRAEYKSKWLGNYNTPAEAEYKVLIEEKDRLHDRLEAIAERMIILYPAVKLIEGLEDYNKELAKEE